MPFDYKKEYREFYLPPKKPHLITIPRMNFVAVHGKGDPPLEGLWHQKGVDGVDYAHKETFEWTSMIRLPEFVTPEAFDWAVQEATAKKKKDFSKAEFLTYDEGLCVQCLHIGPYDEEPKTLAQMDAFAVEQGYRLDFSETRFHHEIYLSDPRRAAPGTPKTVLRHPIREK